MYAKPPFGEPERVLKYLGRYTHRVALSDSRLASVDGGGVRFHYKDCADDARTKAMTLSGVEFLRRFALHVMSPRFVRIRHYGLLAHRDRDVRLALCRRLLAAEPCCPHCGGRRLIRRNLPDTPSPDTS